MAESTSELRPETIDVLANAPEAFHSMLGGLPASVIEAPGEEGWSPRDLVGHVLTVEASGFIDRVRAIVEQDGPAIENIDEHELLAASGVRERPLPDILREFNDRRAASVAYIRALSPEQLARTGAHSVVGEISAADIIHHIASHDCAHIAHAANLIKDGLNAHRGPMQAF
ncbi:MAG TPA: DinB family protein [Dehalococcoidia bacterium]|nr:DinB family protein [Dehalococcoidia bacterium]